MDWRWADNKTASKIASEISLHREQQVMSPNLWAWRPFTKEASHNAAIISDSQEANSAGFFAVLPHSLTCFPFDKQWAYFCHRNHLAFICSRIPTLRPGGCPLPQEESARWRGNALLPAEGVNSHHQVCSLSKEKWQFSSWKDLHHHFLIPSSYFLLCLQLFRVNTII